FFFSSRRRHTRSLRDWSSDVCSSDLLGHDAQIHAGEATRRYADDGEGIVVELDDLPDGPRVGVHPPRPEVMTDDRDGARARRARSEERRVGKECSSGWWPWD